MKSSSPAKQRLRIYLQSLPDIFSYQIAAKLEQRSDLERMIDKIKTMF